MVSDFFDGLLGLLCWSFLGWLGSLFVLLVYESYRGNALMRELPTELEKAALNRFVHRAALTIGVAIGIGWLIFGYTLG
ncbi:MAG TPA: hypothetical protein DCO65_06425 [Spartobacteria bacterium]|nr:hypothetical protein [Spartobacteria bacterium]